MKWKRKLNKKKLDGFVHIGKCKYQSTLSLQSVADTPKSPNPRYVSDFTKSLKSSNSVEIVQSVQILCLLFLGIMETVQNKTSRKIRGTSFLLT